MAAGDGPEHTPGTEPEGDAPPAAEVRHTFSLLFIAVVAGWKVYEAIVAETVRATIAPSLYILGLAGFALSLLGPRHLRLLGFFAGAALCLAAMALDVH